MIRTLIAAPGAIALALCFASTPASAQTNISQSQARKELVSVIRTQTGSHRDFMREAYATLNVELKALETQAKKGDMTSSEVAEGVFTTLEDFAKMMKTLTAFVASEISFDAGDILSDVGAGLDAQPDYTVHFSTGSGRDIDRAVERLEKLNASYARRLSKRITSLTRKMSKLGYEVTARVVSDIPVSIAPNPDFSYTALNFDTIIDVLVGCSKSDVANDGTLMIGGISNPAKGVNVTVQINAADGAESVDTTTIVGDRFVVAFDSSETPRPEGNYRVLALHESTRVGTTMGLR